MRSSSFLLAKDQLVSYQYADNPKNEIELANMTEMSYFGD